jgi:hypothetical protein
MESFAVVPTTLPCLSGWPVRPIQTTCGSGPICDGFPEPESVPTNAPCRCRQRSLAVQLAYPFRAEGQTLPDVCSGHQFADLCTHARSVDATLRQHKGTLACVGRAEPRLAGLNGDWAVQTLGSSQMPRTLATRQPTPRKKPYAYFKRPGRRESAGRLSPYRRERCRAR